MVTVLVAGDVKGSVPELLNKVAFYHKSGAGPFNMAFCVGPLTSRDRETELAPVLSGEKPPAVPLYFCEPGESPSLAAKLQEHPSEVTKVAENLFYLGRGGVKMVGKLTVAFLGARHTKDDVELCRKAAAIAGYGGADLFLTSQWARGMEVDLPERCFKELSAADVAPAAVGSEGVAEVAVAVKPRYHFAASEGVFFQRPPYLNSSAAGAEDGARHTTRFIALGGLREGVAAPKNKAKKWLHALKLEPIVYMKKEELYRRTADTTGCPYVTRNSLRGSGESAAGAGGSQGTGGSSWASRIAAQEEGRRSDSGMFFWGGRGGRGGSSAGRGAGRGVPNGPVDPTNCTVFVGNLVYGDVTSEQLETLFGAVGPIVQVRITPGSVFGFVEFERHQDAARAISSMDGFTVAGNQMRLTWGNQKNRRTPAGMDGGTPQVVDPSNMNLFVGNLPKDGSVSKQDIREALVTAGAKVADIVDVRLTYKGYAFVDFSSHEAAARAMDSMQDKQIKGSHVSCRWGKVSPARARQEAEMQNRGGMQEIETKAGVGGTTARARQETDPRQECWFCLASPHLEDHLVCSVADEVYMAQPKGALVPGHVLIIPVSHQQRYSELSDQGVSEVERYKVSFSKYCYSHSCEPFMFERCIPMKGAHHMHIQAVAIPTGEASRGARILMRSEGNRLGMGFTEVPGDADLKTELKEGSYFFAEGGNVDPMGRRRSVPLQFGRDVAARLLSMPERAYWRDCVLPKEKEISQADVLKEAFKAFDFTQADDEEGEGEEAEAEADAGAGKPGTGDGDTSSVGHKRPAGDGDEGGRGSPRELDDSKKGAERDSEKRPRVEVS